MKTQIPRIAKTLTEASEEPIEQHKTAFGQIVVAKLMREQHLAFAIEEKWPMSVLEIHHINRTSVTTEPLGVPADLPASDVMGMVNAISALAPRGKSAGHFITPQTQILIAAACAEMGMMS